MATVYQHGTLEALIAGQLGGTLELSELLKHGDTGIGTLHGADVKIMDRFFRHREVPDSENFSKPGFQLKKASFLGVFVGRTGPRPAGERKQVV